MTQPPWQMRSINTILFTMWLTSENTYRILTQCGMSFGTAVNCRLLQSTISPKHEHTSGHRTYWGCCWASVRVPRPRKPTAPKKHHHHITRIVVTQADAILLRRLDGRTRGPEHSTRCSGEALDLNNTQPNAVYSLLRVEWTITASPTGKMKTSHSPSWVRIVAEKSKRNIVL